METENRKGSEKLRVMIFLHGNLDGRWARSDEEKAEVFAVHLCNVFEPHPLDITIDEEKKLLTNTNISAQMAVPAMPFTNEV